MAKAPTRRQLQGEASRKEILDAATRLMSSRGYEGTTVAALVKESGLPATSIYWHFASKEGVLSAVMEREARAFFDALPHWDDFEGEPLERLRMTFQRAAQIVREHPAFLRLFLILLLEHESGPASRTEVVHRVREEGRQVMHEEIRLAFAPHGTRKARRVADRLVDFAQGAFDGVYLATHYNPDLDVEALMDMHYHAIVALANEILAEGGRSRR